MGGVQEMGAGVTGYFTATLDMGSYLLISETPDIVTRKLIKLLTVQ